MKYPFIRIVGVAIALALLLVLIIGAGQPSEATTNQSQMATADGETSEQTGNPALICVALVGGTALLAGSVWMEMLFGQRRKRGRQVNH